MADNEEFPKELPKDPKGWTRSMAMHLNFGRKGGSATYEVFDNHKRKMPIFYSYDTRKGGETGFGLPEVPHLMNWEELRAIWPVWLEKQRAARPVSPSDQR